MSVDINFYPHQRKIIQGKVKRRGIQGGVGSGKSLACMTTMMLHALMSPKPTQVAGVMRTAKEATTKLRSDILEKWKDVIVSQSKELLVVRGGSKIHLLGGWDDEKGVDHLDGYNLSCFWMSQAERCPYQTIGKLRDRSRNKAGGEIIELIEGNPNGKDWTYDEYVRGLREVKKTGVVGGREYTWSEYVGNDSIMVNVPTQEFPWLPEHYIQQITRGRSQKYIDRYVKGLYTDVGGVIYDCWDDREHIVEAWPIKKELGGGGRFARLIGIDWGWRDNNPTAVVWMIYDRMEDTYTVYRDMTLSKMTDTQVAEEIMRATGDEVVDCVLVDPSTKIANPNTGGSIYNTFCTVMKDWTVLPADNDVKSGIDRVYWYLAERKMWFFDCVETTTDAMKRYEFKEDVEIKPLARDPTERPRKKDDHWPDAVRYVVQSQELYRDDTPKQRARRMQGD